MFEKLKKIFGGRKSENSADDISEKDGATAAEETESGAEEVSECVSFADNDAVGIDGITAEEVAGLPAPVAVAESGAEITAEEVKSVAEKERRGKKAKRAYTDEFYRFAEILGTDEKTVIEDCKRFQIKNITARLSKVVVRYGVSEGDGKKLVSDAIGLGIGEIVVSPAYLNSVIKNLPANEEVKVCAVVDFPFGESSFKVKLSEVKNSVKRGVDGVIVVINAASLGKNGGELKKQLKKIGKTRAETGVAVSAENLGKEEIKTLLKIAEKTVDYTVFLFGGITEEELSAKMKEINAFKGAKPVKVLANADKIAAVQTLFGLGADGILTPFAEDIAKELFSEFGIKR